MIPLPLGFYISIHLTYYMMSFARISELLDTKNRIPTETNELTELIQNHASENVINQLDSKIEKLDIKIESKFEVLETKIDATNQRIDETNRRIDETNQRIDETNKRFDSLKMSNRWIIGILIGIFSTGLGILALLVRVMLSMN